MKIGEKNFIHELKKKNEKALNYVIDTYGWIINAVVKKHLYNMNEAQNECVNDIFMAVWNNIEKFDEEKGEFKSWVAGIAKFKCIDYKRKYLKEMKNQNIEDMELSIPDNCSEHMIRKELQSDIRDMLNVLKEEDKELFYKIYIEEKEISDVMEETGIKRENIYNRVSRGRKKIKTAFKILQGRG